MKHARTYQQQLDHLNVMVTKLGNHINKALKRRREPIVFEDWLNELRQLAQEVDDTRIDGMLYETEDAIMDEIKTMSEDEKYEAYIGFLRKAYDLLATTKQIYRTREHEESSEYYLCAGDREYEIVGNEFRVNGEIIKLKPKEMQIMRMLLENPTHTIAASNAAAKIYDDRLRYTEIPRIISDINAKLPVLPHPVSRIGRVVDEESHSSVYRLYLHDEPRS